MYLIVFYDLSFMCEKGKKGLARFTYSYFWVEYFEIGY